MRHRTVKRSKKTGLPPGSLIHIGNRYAEKSKITLIRYDATFYSEKHLEALAHLNNEENKKGITWINIDGLQDIKLFEDIGELFGLHPLVLEDILNTDQRPKMEDYGDYIYLVLKNFHGQENGNLLSDQISIILGKDFILSFTEKESDFFEPIKEKISKNKGRIRKEGADYLAHTIIDNIVDNYFIMLEGMEENMEHLEDALLNQTTPATLHAIHNFKRELIFLRKSLWPLREAISSLERLDSPLINKSTGIYFRDIFDHIIAVIDTVETFRDMISGMLDIYLSSISNKLNEVMKVLTIIATIFMPLTFLAGVYGMNFKFMPELEFHWGYYGVLGVMLAVALLMLIYFKKKKWL
ncbi:MAG: magnesium and cobalt transport protein CorA [Deltaproteobacteria bacterium RBG_16_44_11]|nr:MAG: magnesium and cobalt transport protein CorA [Deltaproteobacteria bacterium RBG_16_44_11]